jgi:hypothetical protein
MDKEPLYEIGQFIRRHGSVYGNSGSGRQRLAEPSGRWKNIPPGGVEGAVAKITGKEQEMVGDSLRLATSVRNPPRGKRVAKIH